MKESLINNMKKDYFSNKKGTKIYINRSGETLKITVVTKEDRDYLIVDKEDITSVLDDYRVILIVLKRDKIAKRWFKREAGEIVVGINGERLKEFILPDGTFDEDKAWRVSQEGAEKLKSRI